MQPLCPIFTIFLLIGCFHQLVKLPKSVQPSGRETSLCTLGPSNHSSTSVPDGQLLGSSVCNHCSYFHSFLSLLQSGFLSTSHWNQSHQCFILPHFLHNFQSWSYLGQSHNLWERCNIMNNDIGAAGTHMDCPGQSETWDSPSWRHSMPVPSFLFLFLLPWLLPFAVSWFPFCLSCCFFF